MLTIKDFHAWKLWLSKAIMQETKEINSPSQRGKKKQRKVNNCIIMCNHNSGSQGDLPI